MNPIVNVNLGGLPFAIDADAYERLTHYLDRIHAHFRASEGYEEITGDIEARLAELFRENGRPIVTDRDVLNAIEIMGTPEEFGAEGDPYAAPTEEAAAETSGANGSKWKMGKRLFRDEENAVLGGVAAGLSAYLGIENPLWVRIGFVLLTLGGGLSVIVYPLLWIAVPPARNASERLAMNGQKIDINSIGTTIENDLRRFGSRMNEKFGDAEKVEQWGNRFGKQVEGAVYTVGRGVQRAFRPGSILRGLLRLLLILLLIAAALFWIATVLSVIFGFDFLGYVYSDQPLGLALGTAGALILGTVPLTLVSLLLMRTTSNPKLRGGWFFVPLASFLLGGVLLGISVGNVVNDFKAEGEIDSELLLTDLDLTQPLRIEVDQDRIYRTGEWDFGNFEVGPTELAMHHADLYIKRTVDTLARLVVERVAQGRNIANAEALAARIEYPVRTDGNTLLLPDWFAIPEGTPMRGQRVRVRLELPERALVQLGKEAAHLSRGYRTDLSPYLKEHRTHHHIPRNEVLLMTQDGLTLVDSTTLSLAE